MIDPPWWFLAGVAVFLVILVGLIFSRFRGLWTRMREHPEELDDVWDPFTPPGSSPKDRFEPPTPPYDPKPGGPDGPPAPPPDPWHRPDDERGPLR
jgi:hypothetical protein